MQTICGKCQIEIFRIQQAGPFNLFQSFNPELLIKHYIYCNHFGYLKF